MFGGYTSKHYVNNAIDMCLGPCFSGCLVGTHVKDTVVLKNQVSRSLF